MPDKHLNKCKKCTKWDNKTSNGIHKRRCCICSKSFNTTLSEIKSGGGNCCSRKCWYVRLRKVIKKGQDSPNWMGNKPSYAALHIRIKKVLGKPKLCKHCKTTTAKLYDWASKSRKYTNDIKDWIRLCRKCHVKYDEKYKIKKWKQTVKRKYNWKV